MPEGLGVLKRSADDPRPRPEKGGDDLLLAMGLLTWGETPT
jgi:hypothetical protein